MFGSPAAADSDTRAVASPVQFARAVLGRLGVASDRTLQAYEDLFYLGDQAAFPVLMQAQTAK